MRAVESNRQILIVDRDIAAVEPLRLALANEGFVVRAITDGSAAIVAVSERPPHLVIVDWDMPGYLGVELIDVVRRVVAPQTTRLMILSALSAEHDVVDGLELGADDYIFKPYSVRETVARAVALLRSLPKAKPTNAITCDELVLDAAAKRVTAHRRPLLLSSVEFRLLEFLMSNAGKTFNRSQLLSHVWGDDCSVDPRTVDVSVQRLRKVLAEPGYDAYIQTVRGFGYRFSMPCARA